MALINSVDKYGQADPAKYEKPLLVTREQYTALVKVDVSEETDMEDVNMVAGALNDLAGKPSLIAKWVLDNEAKYLAAIKGGGFEVKRFQVKIEFPDGDVIYLTESEDYNTIKTYVDDLKKAWTNRQYILRNRDDKGVDVRRMVRSATNGEDEEKTMSILRVVAVSPRKRAGTENLRFPDPKQVQKEQ